jgi:predicted transcriptional regulator
VTAEAGDFCHEPAVNRSASPFTLNQTRPTIAGEEPAGIRETARLVGRGVRQVHRNPTELEELGPIDFETDGQSKRPTVWYDTIELDPPLLDSDGESDTADA